MADKSVPSYLTSTVAPTYWMISFVAADSIIFVLVVPTDWMIDDTALTYWKINIAPTD